MPVRSTQRWRRSWRSLQLHQTLRHICRSWQAYVQGIHDKLTPLESSL
ncbi:MAG TPA: hypothetical protein VGO93_32035 [Candidatus Xenobia bacterium]